MARTRHIRGTFDGVARMLAQAGATPESIAGEWAMFSSGAVALLTLIVGAQQRSGPAGVQRLLDELDGEVRDMEREGRDAAVASFRNVR